MKKCIFNNKVKRTYVYSNYVMSKIHRGTYLKS